MQDVNRLKIVLLEQKKGGFAMLITSWRASSKWLSEKLGISWADGCHAGRAVLLFSFWHESCV